MVELLYIPFGNRRIGLWSNNFGSQTPVKNKNEILDIVDRELGLENIGISVCTYKDGIPYLLFVPFDFDSVKDLKLAWNDATKLYNHFVELNLDVHLIYSGKKGFHVMVSVEPKPYSKECIRSFQKWFIKQLDLKTADIQIFGDNKRIMRMPYTFNLNGGLCREIQHNEGNCIDIDNLLLQSYISKPITYEKRDFHDYPCIEELVKEDPEPRELIRLSYVALRLSNGWSEDEIIDEIKEFGWIDMDEEICRRKIEYISNGNYVPLGCKSIKDMDMCLKERCKYYNGNMDKDLEALGIK